MRRERFKFVVWTIVVANVLLLMGLLIQGCRGEPDNSGTSGGSDAEMGRPDTNGAVAVEPTPYTNAPVTPAFEATATNTTAEATVTNAAPQPVLGSARQYAVVKGDSLYKIARANGISMKALADANPGVKSAKLKVGQVLQLPAGAEPVTGAAPPTPREQRSPSASSTARASRSHYVVKPGDSLGRIARAHGTTVQAIKATNRLTSDCIAVGQSLKMPRPRAASARRGAAPVDGPEERSPINVRA